MLRLSQLAKIRCLVIAQIVLLHLLLAQAMSETKDVNFTLPASSKSIQMIAHSIPGRGMIDLGHLAFQSLPDENVNEIGEGHSSMVDVIQFKYPGKCNGEDGCDIEWTEFGVGTRVFFGTKNNGVDESSEPSVSSMAQWCCTHEAVANGLCSSGQQGQLIVNLEKLIYHEVFHRTLFIPSGGDFKQTLHQAELHNRKEGVQVVLLANCKDRENGGRDVQVVGRLEWKSEEVSKEKSNDIQLAKGDDARWRLVILWVPMLGLLLLLLLICGSRTEASDKRLVGAGQKDSMHAENGRVSILGGASTISDATQQRVEIHQHLRSYETEHHGATTFGMDSFQDEILEDDADMDQNTNRVDDAEFAKIMSLFQGEEFDPQKPFHDGGDDNDMWVVEQASGISARLRHMHRGLPSLD